jgi:hypothetical protein
MTRLSHAALACALAASLPLAAALAADKPSLDTATIESVTGLKVTYNAAEGVYKVSRPRDDVRVTVDRMPMPSFMGLTSWAAFMPMGDATMLMSDTVLFEDEVNPVMSAALDAGLEVTALHNHFFFDQRQVFFMHIGGVGDTKRLAAGVRAVYDRVAQVRAAHPQPESAFPGDIATPSHITAEPIEKILGEKSQSKDGMVKVTIGRQA